ncbi:unnamed protein product [Albugo candida]|uniref:Uncharacterized protein n=1 Tax=Albugo candida TaxID=65357 RepID=A0A024FWQ1_9STRA|nr:unnamed protein product [Albugo candida]|eukprot:CCI11603.1 unnamed protein product [Albugo candida]
MRANVATIPPVTFNKKCLKVVQSVTEYRKKCKIDKITVNNCPNGIPPLTDILTNFFDFAKLKISKDKMMIDMAEKEIAGKLRGMFSGYPEKESNTAIRNFLEKVYDAIVPKDSAKESPLSSLKNIQRRYLLTEFAWFYYRHCP